MTKCFESSNVDGHRNLRSLQQSFGNVYEISLVFTNESVIFYYQIESVMTHHKSYSREHQSCFVIIMVSSELFFSTYADWQALSYRRVTFTSLLRRCLPAIVSSKDCFQQLLKLLWHQYKIKPWKHGSQTLGMLKQNDFSWLCANFLPQFKEFTSAMQTVQNKEM